MTQVAKTPKHTPAYRPPTPYFPKYFNTRGPHNSSNPMTQRCRLLLTASVSSKSCRMPNIFSTNARPASASSLSLPPLSLAVSSMARSHLLSKFSKRLQIDRPFLMTVHNVSRSDSLRTKGLHLSARSILQASWIKDVHTSPAIFAIGESALYWETVQSKIHLPSVKASKALPRSRIGFISGSQLWS